MAAEAVLPYIVGKLGDLLIQEAILLHGVTDQVKWLQRELRWMQGFLKDADRRKLRDDNVKNWVTEVRDVAYDAEDAIDTYIYRIALQKRGGWLGATKRCAFSLSEFFIRHTLGKEIEDLELKINSISESRSRYSIEHIDSAGEGTSSFDHTLRKKREFYALLNETDVIGFQEDGKMLVDRLIGGESRRCVVSIVAIGGAGKTTLAKKVYNCSEVKNHFSFRNLVYVSQDCRLKQLFIEILKCFMNLDKEAQQQRKMKKKKKKKNPDKEMNEHETVKNISNCHEMNEHETEKNISNCEEVNEEEVDEMTEKISDFQEMNETDMAKMISNFLKDKRYLIVIDDIWKKEDWDLLNYAFPDDMNGSRVMITTRIEGLALHADPLSPPYKLRLLEKSESWNLFLKKVFIRGDARTNLSPQLENIGRQIVEKCRGLPLAIVLLGGLLSTKEKAEHVWRNILQHINQHLSEGQDSCLQILALSYSDLPYNLKPCFLYFGLFPEDSDISVEKLVRLWVAEGLVQQDNGVVEDVGKNYLEELIDRNMIQVAKRRSYNSSLVRCRIHDLMRDLCITEAKQNKFFQIYGGDQNDSICLSHARRFTKKFDTGNFTDRSFHVPYAPHLRSVLYLYSFNLEGAQLRLGNMKLLRILDLENVRKLKLPEEIGKLVHLRYLAVNTATKVPSSVSNLMNLQVLRVTNFSKCRFPNVVEDMKQLRHLSLELADLCPLRLGDLNNLQTLFLRRCLGSVEGLTRLKNLRELDMRGEMIHSSDNVLSFPHLHHLHSLRLEAPVPFKFPCEPRQFPPNLAVLALICEKLTMDMLQTLEKLPNLVNLKIYPASAEEEFVFSQGGFRCLQVLRFNNLIETEKLEVEKGAMPVLQRLKLEGLHNLRRLPKGLQHLTTLKELLSKKMPEDFNDRLRRKVGPDWHKVRHICSIIIEDELNLQWRRAEAVGRVKNWARPKYVREAWEKTPDSVREVISLHSGLHKLIEMDIEVPEPALFVSLAERWNKSTCSFHFPCGEMTVTPLDFCMLSGLNFGGKVINLERKVVNIGRVETMVGKLADGMIKSGVPVQLSWLRFQDDAVPQGVKSILARRLILITLGYTVFSNGADDWHYSLLDLLADLEKVGDYDWGSAAYATFIHFLSLFSSINYDRSYWSMWYLLEFWAFEYFPKLAPLLKEGNKKATFPAISKWHPSNWLHKEKANTTAESHSERLARYRKYFDDLTVDQINWQPWVDHPSFGDPKVAIAKDMTERRRLFKMPFNCQMDPSFNWVDREPSHVWYLPERVLRQVRGKATFLLVPKEPPEKIPEDASTIRTLISTGQLIDEYLEGEVSTCVQAPEIALPTSTPWITASSSSSSVRYITMPSNQLSVHGEDNELSIIPIPQIQLGSIEHVPKEDVEKLARQLAGSMQYICNQSAIQVNTMIQTLKADFLREKEQVNTTIETLKEDLRREKEKVAALTAEKTWLSEKSEFSTKGEAMEIQRATSPTGRGISNPVSSADALALVPCLDFQ